MYNEIYIPFFLKIAVLNTQSFLELQYIIPTGIPVGVSRGGGYLDNLFRRKKPNSSEELWDSSGSNNRG